MKYMRLIDLRGVDWCFVDSVFGLPSALIRVRTLKPIQLTLTRAPYSAWPKIFRKTVVFAFSVLPKDLA